MACLYKSNFGNCGEGLDYEGFSRSQTSSCKSYEPCFKKIPFFKIGLHISRKTTRMLHNTYFILIFTRNSRPGNWCNYILCNDVVIKRTSFQKYSMITLYRI